MTPKLVETAGDGSRTREILIQGEEFLIGRGADCNLRLAQSAVSRHHCLLRFRGGEVTLSDLGSSNGTWVNGKRVRSQVPLRSGDEVHIGDSSFVLVFGDAHAVEDAGISPTATTCRIPAAEARKRGGTSPGSGDDAKL